MTNVTSCDLTPEGDDDEPGVTWWHEQVARHRDGIRKRHARSRGSVFAAAVSAESLPPTGQAGAWYDDVAYQVPVSARDVARQLARLCGDDSQVAVPWRSLEDAVNVRDRLNRTTAYVQSGVHCLERDGWLSHETVGTKRGAVTTFYLMPGDATFVGRRVEALEAVA